jgi:hypothetical protein
MASCGESKPSEVDINEQLTTCECCGEQIPNSYIVGCCSDGNCVKKIENMCQDCATWHEDFEQWFCPTCQDNYDNTEKKDD